MAIGSSVTLSVPTVGSTDYTLTKCADGSYHYFVTDANGNSVPIELVLRPSSVGSSKRAFSGTLKFAPNAYDGSLGSPQGKISLAFTGNATLGDNVDESEVIAFVQYLASVLTQTAIMTALVEGSYE
jgi:hypothetical protein